VFFQPKFHVPEIGAKRPREESPPSSEDEKGPDIEDEKPDIDRLLEEAEPVEIMDLQQVFNRTNLSWGNVFTLTFLISDLVDEEGRNGSRKKNPSQPRIAGEAW
jgi:hypothetical protein